VTLVFESVTKKQELFEFMTSNHEKYNIYCNGRKIYSDLSEEDYLDVMQDLAEEFYEKGSSAPHEINTEIIKEN
jgi:hypothetical protein